MARVFISYASADTAFASRLATSLAQLGHAVWIDRQEIVIGDSLIRELEQGIAQADYLIIVLSKHTSTSLWMEHEWQMKYHEEITQRRTVLLPIVLEECVIPFFLRHKRFADFRTHYEIGLSQLAITLHTLHRSTALWQGFDKGHQLISNSLATETGVAAWYTLDMVHIPAKFSEISVELGVPYLGKITGNWKPDADEQYAAWELYVELVTRVPVASLQPNEGSLREALSSLYTIFTITRDILHKYGPAVARPKQDSQLSFGYLAIAILNFVLRPILAKWHPLLLEYEHARDPSVSTSEHERRWEQGNELRQALYETRRVLVNYSGILAQVAGVPELHR